MDYRALHSFKELTGEDSEAFPSDEVLDPNNPIDDPDSLEFIELRDSDGNLIEPGSEAAETEVVVAIRRTTLAARLKAIYGDIDKVDGFVGMMSEPHLPGSEFGALQSAIWQRQFEATRDGDRFFYANDSALEWIEKEFGISFKRTLAQIIIDNTDLDAGEVPPNVFKVSN